MARGRPFAVVVVFAVLVAACGSSEDAPAVDAPAPAASDDSTADDPAETATLPLQIQNQGGSMEGHTPRGFAGSGTGLFAGDNLNPGFPDGDGVQIWLTFDLPPGTPAPARAVLTSEVLTVRGSPFDDLGALRAEAVRYDAFGPELFDLTAIGPAVDCIRVQENGLDCDVTEAVARAVDAGEGRAQFRLVFESAGDSDGEADLALFFLTDTNTNERGIFTLALS